MRPLTDEETRVFFEKLAQYIGRNIKALIDRPDDPHCFRLHKDRVYYLSERVMKQATAISREDLAAMGTLFGKFTKSRKFMLKVTCIDFLAQHAKYKVWVKPSAEMAYLYGNDVPKSGIARMTENIPQYADLDPTQVVVLHQADIGEYLRMEEELT